VQVLRPRRAVQSLALTRLSVLPSPSQRRRHTRGMNLCEAQWLAYVLSYQLPPSRRATHGPGADVDRYSVITSDSHRLLVAGLPAHCEKLWTLPSWLRAALSDRRGVALRSIQPTSRTRIDDRHIQPPIRGMVHGNDRR
jgi:hypothetical protein